MKFSATAALLGVTAPLAAAFPAAMMEAIQNEPKLLARVEEMMDKRQAGAGAATAIFEPVPTFSEKQRIDLSNYPWKAPGKNDLRGPCPGLNAFANHGLLPRNGYATVQQYIDVTEKVVGMGPVLSTFLSVLGGAIDSGELTAWSMGGTPPPGVGGLLAGNGKGLSGSHNKYESDASPTRPDLYDPSSGANDYKTVASQFQELIDYCPGSVTMECLTSFRSHRFDTQIARNPYFFNGPFTGVLVQPAAYTFIYRFMANHTAANPTGELSYDVIKSWFGIQGNDGSYVAKQGWERIPDNWVSFTVLSLRSRFITNTVLSTAVLSSTPTRSPTSLPTSSTLLLCTPSSSTSVATLALSTRSLVSTSPTSLVASSTLPRSRIQTSSDALHSRPPLKSTPTSSPVSRSLLPMSSVASLAQS
jgi:hypothetical protein